MKPTVAVCCFVVMIWFSILIGVARREGRHGSCRQEVECGVPEPFGVGPVGGVPSDAGVLGGGSSSVDWYAAG
jgi:hypothetical protein